jgi:hypothetical protein
MNNKRKMKKKINKTTNLEEFIGGLNLICEPLKIV